MRSCTADVIGLDWAVDMGAARRALGPSRVVQGNVDPMVLFGGEVIKSFSLAMMWGIFVGTYSSIFICSPILIYLGVRNEARIESKPGTPGASGNRKPKIAAE